MKWLRLVGKLLSGTRPTSRPNPSAGRARPRLEELESRLVPYSVTGNAWPDPQTITISFVPDGTTVATNGANPVGSNLFASFNSNPRLAGQWQNIILKAAQTWAQQTNINFVLVSDSGATSGSGPDEQGDPTMGDIRICGYNFGTNSLGVGALPPPANNYSVAGDIAFNTGQNFSAGSTYDLFTVAMHEFGHVLGLGHSTFAPAVMYSSYNGIKGGLAADDITAIRSVYSSGAARAPDAYAPNGGNHSFGTAANLNSLIDPNALTATVNNLDSTTTSDNEYFTFNAPQNTTGTLNVTVQSAGLSLFSPQVTVYASDQQTVLGSANGLNQYGATLSIPISNVTPGQQFYVKVQPATTSAFGTGRYAMTLNFGSGSSPTVNTSYPAFADGTPQTSSGGLADGNANTDTLDPNAPIITGISRDTGGRNSGVTNASYGLILNGTAPSGYTVNVYLTTNDPFSASGYDKQLLGSTTASRKGRWTFEDTNTQASGTYTFVATSVDGQANQSGDSTPFSVVVDNSAPAQGMINGVLTASGVRTDGMTNSSKPTLVGASEASDTVQVYLSGLPYGKTTADGSGNWTFTTKFLPDGSYNFTITVTDQAGNTSPASANYVVTINTQAPPPPIINSISTFAAGGGVESSLLQGTAQANACVQVFSNGVSLGSTFALSNGNWSFMAPWQVGTQVSTSFTTNSIDAFGNSSPTSAAFTVLTPQITGVRLGSLGAALPTLVVGGVAAPNSLLQLFLGSAQLGLALADNKGSWSFNYTVASLPAGTFNFSVANVSLPGNASTVTTSFVLLIGGSAPVVGPVQLQAASILSITGNGTTKTTSNPTFAGSATAGCIITILDGNTIIGTTVADANGNWSFTSPTLAKGKHTIYAEATDTGGDNSLLSSGLNIQV